MKKLNLLIIALVVIVAGFVAVSNVEAAALTSAADYMNRNEESLTSGVTHEIQFTSPTGVGTTANTITLTFPDADDTLWCRTAGALTVTTSDLHDGATAVPGTLTAACAQTNDTITISGVDTLTASTLYAVRVADDTGILGTPTNATTGIVSVDVAGVDSGFVALNITDDDEITLTADINPFITFDISNNALDFGTMTTANEYWATAGTAPVTAEPAAGEPTVLTLDTNAQQGAVVELKSVGTGLTAGLWNAGTSHEIAPTAANTVAAGTESYAVYTKNATSITLDADFDSATSTGVLTAAYQTIATVAGPVDGASFDLVPNAAISSVTPSGHYDATLTAIATGKF